MLLWWFLVVFVFPFFSVLIFCIFMSCSRVLKIVEVGVSFSEFQIRGCDLPLTRPGFVHPWVSASPSSKSVAPTSPENNFGARLVHPFGVASLP